MQNPATILRMLGKMPSPDLSQNFLCDYNVVAKLVKSMKLEQTNKVIEVGPGTGIITEEILKLSIDQYVGVEIDNTLTEFLRDKWNKNPVCRFINSDILKENIPGIIGETDNYKRRNTIVVSSLPYGISGKFFRWLILNRSFFDRAVIVLQKEVVDRLKAQPGSKKRGVLSVLADFYFQIDFLFSISSNSFYPPPDVQSAAIRIFPGNRYELPTGFRYDQFEHVVSSAFSARRKKLKNALKNAGYRCFPYDFNGNKRAETLSTEEFILLTVALDKTINSGKSF